MRRWTVKLRIVYSVQHLFQVLGQRFNRFAENIHLYLELLDSERFLSDFLL